eukprot:TRINITY_DN3873_c2_g1_i1.p1 TRINITY_DN3873_c2_g1~~TRINITY_DN3873_c2_g1_i1.p1  ORF type:complete len:286 (-),score=45.10 TRINITY_DN3873_c2_g1_i1:93-950(-)
MAGAPRNAKRMALEELRSLRVPGYVLMKKLAEGLQGKVFAAVRGNDAGNDLNGTAEQVALKMYHGEEAGQSFQREVRILKALQGHYNIVRLLACFEGTQGPIAAFELCKTDLHTYSSRRRLSEVDAVSIMRGAIHALEYVHALEIVHRDVKPENIAIAGDDSPRLIDFGTATWLSDEIELENRCGSPGYMAPELFVDEEYGSPVDVFALGATFYFVLGRQYAIAALDMSYEDLKAHMKRYRIAFGRNFRHVSDACKDLILWLMHPCDSWRPDTRLALACPPFVAS